MLKDALNKKEELFYRLKAYVNGPLTMETKVIYINILIKIRRI
jgi:hypothetical protein